MRAILIWISLGLCVMRWNMELNRRMTRQQVLLFVTKIVQLLFLSFNIRLAFACSRPKNWLPKFCHLEMKNVFRCFYFNFLEKTARKLSDYGPQDRTLTELQKEKNKLGHRNMTGWEVVLCWSQDPHYPGPDAKTLNYYRHGGLYWIQPKLFGKILKHLLPVCWWLLPTYRIQKPLAG